MKWISFIIEIAACIISFGICTAVIRAQFRPRDELAWWKYLVFGITFTAVTYFEVGSNLIASFIGMGICCPVFTVISFKLKFCIHMLFTR